MLMAMGFEGFDPVIGEPAVEWANGGSSRRFLFLVHSLDDSRLRIQVTDFHSNTWESIRSVDQLEDMRDSVGIGGTWSEFIDYFVASFTSDNVKLVLEGHSNSAAERAKLIAQKSKGMPRISISLTKLEDSAASESMANISLQLFKGFKSLQNSSVGERGRMYQLNAVMSDEKEGNEIIQNQLDSKRQKLQASNAFDSISSDVLQTSPDKPAVRDQGPKKVPNRVIPAYRRAKVRGALLQNNDADQDN